MPLPRTSTTTLHSDSLADVIVGVDCKVKAYLGSTITAGGGTPPAAFDFEAFAGYTGGIFVG